MEEKDTALAVNNTDIEENADTVDTVENIGLGVASREFGSYTEAGTSDRFIAVYGDEVRWCEDNDRWYVYNGKTCLWEAKDIYGVLNKFKALADDVEASSINANSADDAEDIRTYANKLRQMKFAKPALLFAKEELSCKIGIFDSNPELLGLPNGKVLNAVTGEVLDGDANNMLTRCLNGTPKKDGISDKFKKYIEIFMPIEEERMYFQTYLGSALVGCLLRNPSDKKGLLIDSPMPNTGKTTFLAALKNTFGDYYGGTKIGLITERDTEGNKPDALLAALRGVRIAGISECPDDCVLCADRWKRITGNDEATVREVHGRKLIQFRPEFRLLVMTNSVPAPDKADDKAFRMRFRRISRKTGLLEVDEEADRYVHTQEFADDFITWVLIGTKRYLDCNGRLDDYDGGNLNSCNLPATIKNVIREYIGENDIMLDFFKSYYTRAEITDKVNKVPCCEMMRDYIDYSNERNITFESFMKKVRAAAKRFGGGLEIRRAYCMLENRDGTRANRKVSCVFGIRAVKTEDAYKQEKELPDKPIKMVKTMAF